jgi:long-chain acyl-CoA synthetase
LITVLDAPEFLMPYFFRSHETFRRDTLAVVCGDESLTWGEFGRRTNKVANALIAGGLQKGDRVCLLMQNSVRTFELLWGTIKAGGVIAPLNIMMAGDAVVSTINNAEPKFIFVDEGTQDVVEGIRGSITADADVFHLVGATAPGWCSGDEFVEAASDAAVSVEIRPQDSMSIIYSSGTTGIPKGIEHTHAARMYFPFGFASELDFDRYSVALCSTPLYTNGTWITMLPVLFMGGTVVLGQKFSGAAFLDAVEQHGVTHAFLVPTQMVKILAEPDLADRDLSSVRVILSGGAPLPGHTYGAMVERFSEACMYEIYGMTEGFISIAIPKDRQRGKIGSVGLPTFGADLRVVDPQGKELPWGSTGEIVGWSSFLMKGYFRDPERTEETTWRGPDGRTYVRSGDIGHIDEDGFVYISGRSKDMIISGGINVFASDIEDVLMGHPAVSEAAAIGIPHEKWGETPLAFVILRDGVDASPADLVEWCNARLSKYQRISGVELRDSFPRAAHDKVLKRALRDPYWEGTGRTI